MTARVDFYLSFRTFVDETDWSSLLESSRLAADELVRTVGVVSQRLSSRMGVALSSCACRRSLSFVGFFACVFFFCWPLSLSFRILTFLSFSPPLSFRRLLTYFKSAGNWLALALLRSGGGGGIISHFLHI